MKLWFLPFILLVGCYSPPPIQPPQPPGPIAVGSFRDMEWKCEETDVNDALVWVRCEFHNNFPPIKDVCIKVVYDTLPTSTQASTEVAHSRNICSGPLWASGTNENFAAFFKENRKLLAQACGPKLEKCFMSTVLQPPLDAEAGQ